MTDQWQPMSTLPTEGLVILANYRPTAWAYHPTCVLLQPTLGPRHREIQTRYAQGWMPAPEPPDWADDIGP